jgi:hypothetical protein
MPDKFPDQSGECLKSDRPDSLMRGNESDISGDSKVWTAPMFGCVMFESKD